MAFATHDAPRLRARDPPHRLRNLFIPLCFCGFKVLWGAIRVDINTAGARLRPQLAEWSQVDRDHGKAPARSQRCRLGVCDVSGTTGVAPPRTTVGPGRHLRGGETPTRRATGTRVGSRSARRLGRSPDRRMASAYERPIVTPDVEASGLLDVSKRTTPRIVPRPARDADVSWVHDPRTSPDTNCIHRRCPPLDAAPSSGALRATRPRITDVPSHVRSIRLGDSGPGRLQALQPARVRPARPPRWS